jgi:hypothetical protein
MEDEEDMQGNVKKDVHVILLMSISKRQPDTTSQIHLDSPVVVALRRYQSRLSNLLALALLSFNILVIASSSILASVEQQLLHNTSQYLVFSSDLTGTLRRVEISNEALHCRLNSFLTKLVMLSRTRLLQICSYFVSWAVGRSE